MVLNAHTHTNTQPNPGYKTFSSFILRIYITMINMKKGTCHKNYDHLLALIASRRVTVIHAAMSIFGEALLQQ